jgi:hypothetical protein
MSKLLNLKTMLSGMLLLSVAACKSPVEDVKVVVDMNIMKYSALVHIGDTNGATPQNISVAIGGTSANDIYEISGKKVFTVKDGVITLGLNPSVTPTAAADVNYTVVVSAPGYKSLSRPMAFKNGVMQQIITVTLQKVTDDNPPVASIPVVTPPATPTSTNVILDFTGYCANRKNLQIRPSLYVFYRIKGSGAAYLYLGYMTNGHLETTALTVGKSYDFQITYAGENYNVSGTLDKTSYQETFTMGSSICNTF